MKHKNIKKFAIEGEFIDDSMIPTTRVQFESLLVGDMRSRGYVPVLDIAPLWSTEYNQVRDIWMFGLSVYGVYIGKRKAKECEGLSDGKLLPRSIRKVM
jgi:hypothetical protein